MTDLTQELHAHDIRELRGQLHHLKPVVIIGANGLTNAVIEEIERALDNHELIKIRTLTTVGEELGEIAHKICEKTNSALIQTIGHIIAIYRKNPTPFED